MHLERAGFDVVVTARHPVVSIGDARDDRTRCGREGRCEKVPVIGAIPVVDRHRDLVTRDLARHARHLVASDPDSDALKTARAAVAADNVDFMATPAGMPDLPVGSFDVVIYTLSLHHIPIAEMSGSLHRAAALLKNDGVIMVVEPGEKGSFTLAKEQFGAGSGDERPAKEAAIRAMQTLDGWTMGEALYFYTRFQFDNEEDFFDTMLPGYRQQPENFVQAVTAFLSLHRTANGIILDAERRLNLLRRM